MDSGTSEIPYPKSIFLIITNEFCERFCFYGLRAVLSIYLYTVLNFTERQSKITFHTFIMLVYFFPMIGAIIADSFLGKFKTILYLSMIYVSGTTILALSSIRQSDFGQVAFCLLGLLLIAVGTGGIKPCVSAFGGDQFVLPQQAHHLANYFSMFYFSINAGSLSSTFITPLLRRNVHCFGEKTCYPLAFGLPGLLMIISLVIIIAGKPLYKIKNPKENIVAQVLKCIFHGIAMKYKATDTVDHWLDRAEPKYEKSLVTDVKGILKLLVVLTTFPVFFALFEQQGSGWTLQATRMDGYVGFYTILPDQMQLLNSLFVLMLIPLFTNCFYPLCNKCNCLNMPLQRMVFGAMLAALSFGISAVVSFALEATDPVLPTEGNAQIRIYNPLNCEVILHAPPYVVNQKTDSMGYSKLDVNDVHGPKLIPLEISGCDQLQYNHSSFTLSEKTTNLFYILESEFVAIIDDTNKPKNGFPKIRTLINKLKLNFNLIYWDEDNIEVLSGNDYSIHSLTPGTYRLNNFNKELNFLLGGVYTVLVSINEKDQIQQVEIYQVTEPNTVHMLWLIPQYFVITLGEIMFSITGLEFSYTQAPISMKSVCQASFLLTTAVGNFFVVIIEAISVFKKQSANSLLYAALMGLDTVILAYMAKNYVYQNISDNNET